MLLKILKKYKKLSINAKKTLWAFLFLVIGYFIFLIIFPNPNKWTYIKEFGIKLPLKHIIHGIDVSHHNGKIDWEKVKALEVDEIKINFAFIKASEGTNITDKDFKRNWKEAREKEIVRGAYHYYIPWRDPESQVAIFKKNVSLKSGDLPPVLDIEENSLNHDNKIIKDIGTWLRLIENYYGMKPIIYTNQSYFNKFIKGNFENYPLWIADYSKTDLTLYDKKLLYFWQYSKKGKIEGIDEEVDINSFLMGEEKFNNLRK